MRIVTCVAVVSLFCWQLAFASAADETATAESDPSTTVGEEDVPAPEKPLLVIEEGSRVSIEYVLTTDDGTVVDDNDGDLLVYDQGDSPLLPVVEEALLGLVKGDAKRITLEPEDAFGVIQPELIKTVSATMVPEHGRVVGSQLQWKHPEGNAQLVRVIEVKGDELVIDFNHPLAGERLHFDVTVVAVRLVPE